MGSKVGSPGEVEFDTIVNERRDVPLEADLRLPHDEGAVQTVVFEMIIAGLEQQVDARAGS
jgi:hypothetical protein